MESKKYSCEKCGRDFEKKSQHTAHMNRKTPCINDAKMREIIDNAVNQKMTELGIIQKMPVSSKITKPILKWVGGKTQIIDKLLSSFPTKINNYREMFLGGGSVLLALLSYVKQGHIRIDKNIYAYDLNEPLIYMYKNIQSNPRELFDELQNLISIFNRCPDSGTLNRSPTTIEEAMEMKENYYYWIRMSYNQLTADDKKTIRGSAMFIFLNKTCFRGVFRVGPRGFNVPYGHYKNPEIISEEHLMEIHDLIQPVIFQCCDFKESFASSEEGDFAYLDPPYAPETITSFVGYTENGFSTETHIELFQLIHTLTKKNVKIMMSNSSVELVHSNFNPEMYNITTVLCKRSINSKTPDAKTNEVIITNYNQDSNLSK